MYPSYFRRCGVGQVSPVADVRQHPGRIIPAVAATRLNQGNVWARLHTARPAKLDVQQQARRIFQHLFHCNQITH